MPGAVQPRRDDGHTVAGAFERPALRANRHLSATERVGVLIGDDEYVHAVPRAYAAAGCPR